MATGAQLKIRAAFKKCTRCFGNQPETGGVVPPGFGPRSREWWYDHREGLWYYNNFIQESMFHYLKEEDPPWCRSGPILKDNGFYVDQHHPNNIYDNSAFFFTGAYKYGGGHTPYIRRSFISLNLSAITADEAEKSTGIVLVFSYKNTFHPLVPPPASPINIAFHYVPQEGCLGGAPWNSQPGMAQRLAKFGCIASDNSSIYAGAVKITSIYKNLIENGKTHFNLGLRTANETGMNYPDTPITVYENRAGGEGSNFLAYLSYG